MRPSRVCLVSIMRLQSLIAVSNSTDPTYTNPPSAMWSDVEMNIGIVTSCLPILRPLISRSFPGLFSRITNDEQELEQSNVFSPRKRAYRAPVSLACMKPKRPSISACSDEARLASQINVRTDLDLQVEDRYPGIGVNAV